MSRVQSSVQDEVSDFEPLPPKRMKSLPIATNTNKPSEKPIIVVMGPTGSGKSSLIKGLTGSQDIQIGLTLHSGKYPQVQNDVCLITH
jgi:predicted GTPase